MDRFIYVDNYHIKAGAVLGIGICNAGVYNAEVDAAISMLPEYLEETDAKMTKEGNHLLKSSTLLALGLAYAGSAREEITEILCPFIEDDSPGASMELAAIAALALGMVFVGSGDEDAANSLAERLIIASTAELDQP